jgi:hypothetical protein
MTLLTGISLEVDFEAEIWDNSILQKGFLAGKR